MIDIDKERREFEAWGKLDSMQKRRLPDGSYCDSSVQAGWGAWQARATTAPAPADRDAALMDLQYVAGFRAGRIAEDAGDQAAIAAVDRRAEVAMRALKESAPAAPEGQAALSEAQLDHIARSYFAESYGQEQVKNAIHDAFLAAVPRQAAVALEHQQEQKPTNEDEIVGHKTFSVDGGGFRHEPLRRGEADAIMAQIEASKSRRAELMPDEAAARRIYFDAWLRLKELGWNEAIYCPKDGREFEVIEAGSTGVHRCIYSGEWPSGYWMILDGGDAYPSRPVLYRDIIGSKLKRADGDA